MYQLKTVADKMGLIKSGRKEEIINRITEYLLLSRIKEYKITKPKKLGDEKVLQVKKKISLWKRLAEDIDKEFEMAVYKKDKEIDLERQLYQFLRGKYKESQVKYKQRIKSGEIDLVVDGKVGIELKFRPTKSQLQRLIGQIEDYKEDFNELIVVMAVDSSINRQVIETYKQKLESKGKVKVIVKYI